MTPWVPLAQLDYSKTAVRVSSFFFIANRVNSKLEFCLRREIMNGTSSETFVPASSDFNGPIALQTTECDNGEPTEDKLWTVDLAGGN